jgi:hypothetical protein
MPTANNAFISHCIAIDTLIAELQKQRAAHFGVKPDAQRNWAEVGSVAHIRERLEQAVKVTRDNIIE